MSACADCRLCMDVCPAAGASGDGRLAGAYRLAELRRMVRRRQGLLAWLLGPKEPSAEEWTAYGDTVFKCTLCAQCQEVCPVGIGLKDLWCSVRQNLVQSGIYPKKIDMIRDNLAESHNVFGEDNGERADWVDDLADPPDHGYQKDQAKVVYFTGCVAAFFPLAQKVPLALAEILESLDVDFTLLGEEEWCCGFPLLGAGLEPEAARVIEHNLAAVKAKGAEQVIFACPSCYQMWREHYPPGLRIAHVTEFLVEQLAAKPGTIKDVPLRVTYHDPCDLGRGARVFDAPRALIRAIPGVELVEMERNRENCRCCGGGGNLEMIAPELSSAITRDKIEDALHTGAQAIVTSCQQCLRTMTTYVRRNNVPMDVLDVSQLLARALKKGAGNP
jgi:heterodisulfide reductase subunit D